MLAGERTRTYISRDGERHEVCDLCVVRAEVPMAEMLAYAPDLRSLTGGQGEFTMEFTRYEEIPAHLAQKVVAQATEETAVHA